MHIRVNSVWLCDYVAMTLLGIPIAATQKFHSDHVIQICPQHKTVIQMLEIGNSVSWIRSRKYCFWGLLVSIIIFYSIGSPLC